MSFHALQRDGITDCSFHLIRRQLIQPILHKLGLSASFLDRLLARPSMLGPSPDSGPRIYRQRQAFKRYLLHRLHRLQFTRPNLTHPLNFSTSRSIMPSPSNGDYVIYNRALGHTGDKLAITHNGNDQYATVEPLDRSSKQIVSAVVSSTTRDSRKSTLSVFSGRSRSPVQPHSLSAPTSRPISRLLGVKMPSRCSPQVVTCGPSKTKVTGTCTSSPPYPCYSVLIDGI